MEEKAKYTINWPLTDYFPFSKTEKAGPQIKGENSCPMPDFTYIVIWHLTSNFPRYDFFSKNAINRRGDF